MPRSGSMISLTGSRSARSLHRAVAGDDEARSGGGLARRRHDDRALADRQPHAVGLTQEHAPRARTRQRARFAAADQVGIQAFAGRRVDLDPRLALAMDDEGTVLRALGP